MFAPESVLTGQVFRLTLGLRRLAPGGWLDEGDHAAQVAEKRRLLTQRPDDVVRWLPGSETAAAELLELVVVDLGAHHAAEIAMGQPDPALHPIDAAGRLVCEDLCLLQRSDGQWRLTAASVCFPSRWRLADKIGRTVAEIHGPVPGFEAIAAPVDAFFDRLTADRPMWRTNWSLLNGRDLFQDGREQTPAPAEFGALVFRVERQTLRRLPGSGAAVFTIRTYTGSLADVVAGQPRRAADLAATLRTVGPATLAYKGWTHTVAGLVRWLDERS